MTRTKNHLRSSTPVYHHWRILWMRDHPGWENEVSAMALLARDPWFPVSQTPARYLCTPDVIAGEIVAGDSVLQVEVTATGALELSSKKPLLMLGPALVAQQKEKP